jgi:peptidylprolyl isomerase
LSIAYSPFTALTAATMALAFGPMAMAEQAPQRSQAEIIKQSDASDWRRLDPENTLVLEIHGKPIIMELAARIAPRHVANIRTLARSGYYTSSGVVRVQDNYVAQWADPYDEDKAKMKPLGSALAKLPAEFSIPFKDLPLTRFQDADGWAPVTGFVDGLPVAADPAKNQAWIAHCYGVVGAARGNEPDSSNGTSLYAIIGQAPRALDLNITVVGRVVQGMEVLSSLPRGPGAMGFYEKPEQAIAITRARLLADIPESERPVIEVMRTDTPTWTALVEASRHAIGPWAVRSALHSNICSRSVPTRPIAVPGSS